jgi:hypothetical protein
MRPALFYYCLEQTRTTDRQHQALPGAPPPAESRPRHTRTAQRTHRIRGLPAVLMRRVLTALGDGSL